MRFCGFADATIPGGGDNCSAARIPAPLRKPTPSRIESSKTRQRRGRHGLGVLPKKRPAMYVRGVPPDRDQPGLFPFKITRLRFCRMARSTAGRTHSAATLDTRSVGSAPVTQAMWVTLFYSGHLPHIVSRSRRRADCQRRLTVAKETPQNCRCLGLRKTVIPDHAEHLSFNIWQSFNQFVEAPSIRAACAALSPRSRGRR